MNTYIVNLMSIELVDDSLKCTKSQQGAYFMNLSNAVYFVQNNMNCESIQKEYNYIAIIGMPTGTMNAIPTELYVFKPSLNTNSYDEVKKEDEVYQFAVKHYNVQISENKPVIKLDLSKEELIPTKEFVSSLKENIENKNYGKVKEMIDQKEMYVSNQINGFLNSVSSSLNSVDEAVNKLFDIFNGNF